MKEYCILVNTTDSFEDCWEPFFILFKKYWPEYKGKIYLNSETKDYQHNELNIVCIKNGLTSKPWTQCLKSALDFIEEENIIYLQEDYFLHAAVNNSSLESYFKKFKDNNLDCLHLTDQCTTGPFDINTGIENVWKIKKGASYRLSTQAAFWKNKSLLKILRPWESGWDFEKFGSIRSNQSLQKIMCVNQDVHNIKSNQLLPYVFTGIIKGKWKSEVQDIFKNNNIAIDFKKRGFVNPQKKIVYYKNQ